MHLDVSPRVEGGEAEGGGGGKGRWEAGGRRTEGVEGGGGGVEECRDAPRVAQRDR